MLSRWDAPYGRISDVGHGRMTSLGRITSQATLRRISTACINKLHLADYRICSEGLLDIHIALALDFAAVPVWYWN